jgi:beta-xylosidase
MKTGLLTILFLFQSGWVVAQNNTISKSWVPSVKEGWYRNPILHADYSDPDAIRVGDDYYMTASSFNHVPGLPLLHSKDLVHWRLLGYALKKLVPESYFDTVRHGGGVWAPSIRYHKGEFYIYYPDPDFGIYLVKAKNIEGPWSEPKLVLAGKGLIDPCPLWDEDGRAWLVHAYAGSRAGIKSILAVRQLSLDGTYTLDEGRIVYDGHGIDPTVEGPKLYKRNGWYYIFAPAGGVSTGWQLVLRSRNIYGPYERKIVLTQGTTPVNGPHQGAWVNTPDGSDWFLHFQDREAFGRIVHLQPMRWINDWPVMGTDKDGDGMGEPVMEFKAPVVAKNAYPLTPPESDEFDYAPGEGLGLQWQWQANPKAVWAFPHAGKLRLYAQTWDSTQVNLWMAPHLLMQKWPAPEFESTTRLELYPAKEGDKAGLIVFGQDYAYLAIRKKGESFELIQATCLRAEKQGKEKIEWTIPLKSPHIWLGMRVKENAQVQFFYSEDGETFREAGKQFSAKPGKWVGAKMGLFCNQMQGSNDAGFADIDWWRVQGIIEKTK